MFHKKGLNDLTVCLCLAIKMYLKKSNISKSIKAGAQQQPKSY